MKRLIFSLAILALLGTALGVTLKTGAAPTPFVDDDDERNHDRDERTIVVDVACDARTYRTNRGAPITDAMRGDSFIVNGKIFPGGTIPAGGTPEEPGDFDPDAPGSVGDWTCSGIYNFDFSEIQLGAVPHTASTQLYQFGREGALVSEGLEGGIKVIRAVTGGTGRFSGAVGEVIEEPIGVNRTGLFNIRFTFKLKKQPRR
ncbi:MAG: hypothetical protein M3430_03625 [Acidobacteriota bacterium]|nr:hypothetical protein [Acidobacteriota bacterium]